MPVFNAESAESIRLRSSYPANLNFQNYHLNYPVYNHPQTGLQLQSNSQIYNHLYHSHEEFLPKGNISREKVQNGCHLENSKSNLSVEDVWNCNGIEDTVEEDRLHRFDNCSIKMEADYEDSKPEFNVDDENSSSSEGKPLSERNGKHAKQDPKICGVCGDKALGNNFNAITCESCKAFFRRNALRTKEFVCPFNDACKVDPVTRRFCQKCRLKKCFDIGMKKEWIMTDEEKKIKKQKIEQNRLKRTSSDTKTPHSEEVGEVTAPKVAAVGEELPNKLISDPLTINHSTVIGGNDHQHNQTKQPMMPHNNNTNHLHSSVADGQISSGISQAFQQHQLDPPRLPVIHSPEQGKKSLSNSTPYLPASGIQSPSGYTNSSSSDVPSHNNWGENTENSSTNVLKPEHQQSLNYAHPFSGNSGQPHLEHIHDSSSSSYQRMGSSNNPAAAVVGSEPSESDDPAPMPLLASLIRPGVAESPPEIFAECSNSNSSAPDSPEDHSLSKDSAVIVPSRSILTFSSAEIEHSPPPRLVTQHHHHLHLSEESSSPSQDLYQMDKEMPPLPLNTMDSILSVAISAEFNAFENLRSLGDSSRPLIRDSKELNKAEKAKLNELFFASQALNAPVDADGPIKIETCDPSLINVINLTDIAIRRLIKMSKKICVFKNMCQEDQIALLKGGCTEMMILRSVVSYDPERDSWNIPHSNGYNIKLGVLKEARGNLYEEHQRFVKSFKAEWRSDDNIMIILCAITLFTPERPNVIHKDVVKLEQDSYYYLLKRYLESTRNGCEARSTYLQLIKKIAELHVLNSNHLRVFLEVNPREVEPLLIEIFDLKQ